ncbi:MAG: hypothetical protein QM763_09600 [Agriterribacter sp.]
MAQKGNCPPPPPDDNCGCKEQDNPTQKSINAIRTQWCKNLYDSKGTVTQNEARFNGEKELYREKKCMFVHTEQNYRRYRNFEIITGTEIIQTNDLIKTNVAKLKDWNKSLNAALVALTKQIKDSKTKFNDLNTAACNLKRSYNEKCNGSQKKALTGLTSEKCDEEPKPPVDACKDAASQIDDLICLPGGLSADIDSIWQSASDVVGIQMFSNIDTLDPLQKDLSDKAIKFEKQISDTMKLRKGELDKLQDDLVTSVKAVTLAAMARNNSRAEFEGNYDAVEFLCCPSCEPCHFPKEIIKQGQNDDCYDCPPRLKDCEEAICNICNEVKVTFCCPEKVETTASYVED